MRNEVTNQLTNAKTSTMNNKSLMTFVYHKLFKLALGICSLDNLLINCVSGDKSVDDHRTALTNTVTAILRLQITLRILCQ